MELIAVVVILAIIMGVALPRYFDHAARTKEAACKGALGGVRSGIANFFVNAAINGTPAYPTYAELTTVGTVMQDILPDNPYKGANGVLAVGFGDTVIPRNTCGCPAFGWCYYVNAGLTDQKFYTNSESVPGENFW